MAKSYQVHSAARARTRIQTDIDPDDCIYSLPMDAIPCKPQITSNTISIPVRFPHLKPLPDPSTQLSCPYTDHVLPYPNPPPRIRYHVASWPQQRSLCDQWELSIEPATVDPTIFEYVASAHRHWSTIYHCSNGTVVDDTGSFGWAFGPNTKVMLTHSGPAFGLPMDSYLAESYGLLASSCFWFRMTKLVLHRQRPNFKLKIYCDNQSLVRCVNDFLHYFDGSFSPQFNRQLRRRLPHRLRNPTVP